MDDFRTLNEVTEAPSEDGFWQVPARFNFTRDVVEAFAADRSRPALTFVDNYGVIERRTFADVAIRASRWAALLRARGLVPGDRLLVLVGNTPAWPAILLGALKAGLVAVPCSVTLGAHELALRGEHSDARLVVADREGARELARVDAPVEVVLVEDVADELQRFSPTQPTHDTASDDIAFILYTSGTTRAPKGATHTHAYTWANRLQAEHWLDARPDDLVWCTATPGWAKSIWNVLLGPWSRGAEIVIHEGAFDVEQRFELLQRLGVTVLCQTPTEYRMMADHPSLARFGIGRLRHAVSAGGPLDRAVSEAFSSTFGLTVYEGYGQTENTLLVANAPGIQVKPGSMGRPTPGHKVAVIDDDGNEQPVGAEGEIALWGQPPSLFLGYWNAPDETSAVFRGSWYLTGDRATRDEDGYLWFAGRTGEVIVSDADRINPFEIERALLLHPAIAECAVVGEPHADAGEVVKAFVVLRAGVESPSELVTKLRDWVAATTTYKPPHEIEFVTELPRTASGKIHRAELPQTELRTSDGAHEERLAAEALVQQAALEPEEEALPPDRAERRSLERDERRHKAEEKRRREEAKAAAEKAAADKARRDAAMARRAANAEAKAAAEKAAADKARRDAAKARRATNAEAKATADKAAAKKADQAGKHRRKEEGSRRQAEVQEPAVPVKAAGAQAGDSNDLHESPNAALISRVRAYAQRNEGSDTDPPTN